MKANELMIGDWVMTPYGIARIIMIGEHSPCYTTKTGEGQAAILPRNLQPIPLTPEILEKNGFSYPKQSAWMKLDCPERELLGCLHTDGTLWLYASGDCDKDESFAEIRYVHELQHALKLCRIEKEIKL